MGGRFEQGYQAHFRVNRHTFTAYSRSSSFALIVVFSSTMVAANHPLFYALIGICILLTNIPVHVYSFQQSIISTKTHRATTRPTTTNLFSTAIQPSSTSTIGTVGSGYISILLAKLAAHRNHGKSWIICPAADMEVRSWCCSLKRFSVH